MIIVNIAGGLGNQLFNYAFGRSLSEYYGVPFKLDNSGYGYDALRRYSLSHFNIRENIADAEEVRVLKKTDPGRFLSKFNYLSEVIKPKKRRSYIREKSFAFDQRVFDLPMDRDRYFKGRWQSEKYFASIDAIIRSEFSLKQEERSDGFSEMLSLIKNSQSVSLHVRRGDYASDWSTRLVHGICTVQYYKEAVKFLRDQISDPYFFIFTDDAEWAESNLSFIGKRRFMVSGKKLKDYEELSLMSECRDHIISNSTFSWWGAWLCANEGKIVVAPKKWFGRVFINTKDLLPETWHAM
ncbi:alpha-1,2-fucosyltransferase [Candidatus Falkowbacteria bacterium]|nr:alpha-1,2-fucosyltransferase [Candidatus Falkowbacteria bacterium]